MTKNTSFLIALFSALLPCGQLSSQVTLDPSNSLTPGQGLTITGDNAWTTGPSNWSQTLWDSAGNLENWSASGTSASVSGGVLSGTTTNADAQLSLISIPGGPDLDLGYNDFVEFRLRLPASYSGDIELFFGVTNAFHISGAAQTGFNASRKVTIPNASIPKDGNFHTYRIDLGLVEMWRGRLTDLRLDPATVAGTAFALDFIRVGDVPGNDYEKRVSLACPDAGEVREIANFAGEMKTHTIRSMESKRFRIIYSDVTLTEDQWAPWSDENSRLTLRNLEECWQVMVKKLGYVDPTLATGTTSGTRYKINMTMIHLGGTWSGVDNDDPLFRGGFGWQNTYPAATAPNPPSWVNPHEFMHVCQFHQGGHYGDAATGKWFEAHADYGMEATLTAFPQVFSNVSGLSEQYVNYRFLYATNPFSHYRVWHIFLYLDQNPDGFAPNSKAASGTSLSARLWQESLPGEYIYATIDRLTKADGGPGVKDIVGGMARRNAIYDYGDRKGPMQAATTDWNADTRKLREFSALVRRPDDPSWLQIPAEIAPQAFAYTIHELLPTTLNTAGRVVSVNFRGLPNPARQADWRASLVVVDDAGNARYSPLWNSGSQSVTLAANENRVFLSVAATPGEINAPVFEDTIQSYKSDPAKTRFPYEVQLSGANVREIGGGPTTGLVQHANGGGWKSATANVASTAYIGPNARVLDSATVSDNARVEDFAVVKGNAIIAENAVVSGHAIVRGTVTVRGFAKVREYAQVTSDEWESGVVIEGHARIGGRRTVSDRFRATDHATLKGVGYAYQGFSAFGDVIIDGDALGNAHLGGGAHTGWLWDDQVPARAANVPALNRLFASYTFDSESPHSAIDQFGVTDAPLVGSPSWTDSDGIRSGFLSFNGSGQRVLLSRWLTDFREATFSANVKWNGTGAANQPIFHFGNGTTDSQLYVTPRNASGVCALQMRLAGNTYTIAAPTALPANTWSHVGVTLNGTTAALYLNGSLVGSTPCQVRPDQFLPADTNETPAHNFLAAGTSLPDFQGSIDDFKVHSAAMTGLTGVSVSPNTLTLLEVGDPTPLTFSRNVLDASALTTPLEIPYTISGSATPGSDFTGLTSSGTVTIPAGQTSVTVTLSPVADTLTEGEENFTVTLTPSATYGVANGSTTITMPDRTPLDDDLLAWYRFNETSGTTAHDSSGKNQDATLVNGPAWQAGTSSLSFDDANDDDDLVQTPVPNGGSRTLAAWFRPESSTWNQDIWNFNAVFDSDAPGYFGAGWGIVDNQIRVMLDDTMWDTNIPVTLNTWQHGILTFDATTARFYLNGVLRGTFNYAQGDITTNHYTIGSKGFDGQIRDAKIFGRPVYAVEAMEIYSANAPKAAPRALSAIPGHGQVTLSWQPANAGELSYLIRRATTPGGPYTDVASNVTSTTYIDTSVTNGTTYYYVVAAVGTGGPGPVSNEISATPAAGSALPPPWQDANIGSAAGNPTTSFSAGQVVVRGAGAQIRSSRTTDSFRFVYIPIIGDCQVTAKVESIGTTNTNARAGVMIRESLTAGSTHASMLTTPAASNNRTFMRRTATNQTSTSTNTTNNNAWVRITRTGNVFRAETSIDGSSWSQQGSNVTIPMTSPTCYAGLAVGSGDDASLTTATFSNVTITGGYPTGLAATAGNGQVALAWNAVSGAASYRVKRATSSGGPYTLVASPATNAFSDTTAVNGTTYFYVVSAHNGTAESANSAQVFATPAAPLAATPTNVSATDLGTSASLTWSTSTNATSYRVRRDPSSAGPFSLIASPTTTSFTDTPLNPAENYFYTVSASNADGTESPPSDVVAVIRTLHFDPNGNAPGSVADGGSYAWRATNWAVVTGGGSITREWFGGAMAVFAATSPAGPLSYQVDLTDYDTGLHGHASGIRAQSGAVHFVGNVANFYLTSPATITANPGAAIVFQQSRSGAAVQAFNLNGQPATFHGDITINTSGIGNGGQIIVGSGNLKLGDAIEEFSPTATTLESGTSLTNTGAAGKSFALGSLTMNGATLAASNSGHTSWGNFLLTDGLTVGGSTTSEISADLRCQANTNQVLNIGETGQEVDLRISGKIGHINWIAWSHATKTGPGTLIINGTNDLGSLTVNEGRVVLDGAQSLSGMGNGGLINQNEVEFRIPSGVVAYNGAISGDGSFIKTGDGTLALGAARTINQRLLVNRGVVTFTQASLQRTAQISLATGGQLDLAFTGTNTINSLEIAGTLLPPGIYHAGSHPEWITGTGKLKVAAATSLAWNNSASTNVWNAIDANWTSQPWIHLADALLAHTTTPQTISLNGNLSAVDVMIGNGTNNANYTLLGGPTTSLSALSLTVQGAAANDPGTGASALSSLHAAITTDLRVGRWDLILGGDSQINIAGQLRASSDGNGLGDWGRVTIQDSANVTASGGVSSAGAAWGLTLNGGTLTTPSIRAAELSYQQGSRLTLNGTTLRATQATANFLSVDGSSQAWVGTNGARFDTNGYDIGVGVKLVDLAGQAGSLHKLGIGTLSVTTANTITGPVLVDGGTLFANPGNAATNRAFSYTSGITVNSGATLRSGTNGLFGWDGTQAKQINVDAGGTATVDPGADVNVGLVSLHGGTLAGGPSPTWGSWSFGRAADRKLAVTATSTVSASDVALFGGTTLDVADHQTLFFTGTIVNTNNGASSVIKTGAGSLQMSGENTYSGTTIVRAGNLNLTGAIAAGGELVVADQSEPAWLLSSGVITRTWMRFGSGVASVGAGYQSSGTVTTTLNGGNSFGLGHGANSYGYYQISGGTLQTQELSIGTWGDTNNGGSGMLEITGGTVNNLGWVVLNRSQGTTTPAQRAALLVSAGSLTYRGSGLVANWGSNATAPQVAVITIAGTGMIATLNHTPVALGGNADNTAVLNLNGGALSPSQITGSRGFVHLNGGTLMPTTDSNHFLAVNTAYMLAGGAQVDTNGKNITIQQPLLAPTRPGVVEIPVSDAGSGYTCPPIVTIGAGTGSDATAVAVMRDDGSGKGTYKIARLQITSPGSYDTAPTQVELTGGAPSSPARFGPAVIDTISSGALTKSGVGTLTLTAANSYSGGTRVSAGTLITSGTTATLGTGNLTIDSGATVTLQNPNGSVADSASVALATSAMLNLATGVTETVKFLTIAGVLQPAGTYNATSHPEVISGNGNLVVTDGATPPLSAAELWRLAHFGSTLNTDSAADAADPDTDGLNNTLERAFGLNPVARDVHGAPALTRDGNFLDLTFQHAREATDLTLNVQISSDLSQGSWRDAIAAPAYDADGSLELLIDTAPAPRVFRFRTPLGAGHRFFRIQAQSTQH